MKPFSIAGRAIGKNAPPYCIAEVGINHNGDIAIAKRMIEVAKECGADAVKFQTFKADEFCGDPAQMFTYKSQEQEVIEPMLEMFQRYEFTAEQWNEISRHCMDIGITFFSTPQNSSDLELLLNIGIPAIKVGSDDFTNFPLLMEYAATDVPLILSCGMSDLADVSNALDSVGWGDIVQVVLMLCTSQYPTPSEDVNIRKLNTLQQAFPGLLVGFSDHTQSSLAAAMAVAFGARVFEKHFTLDHKMPGPDHWFSVDPVGLVEWIKTIKEADQILGSPVVRPTEKEEKMKVLARRSIVALRDIGPGEKLTMNNIGLRRPGNGLAPQLIDQVYGLSASLAIQQGELLKLGDMRL